MYKKRTSYFVMILFSCMKYLKSQVYDAVKKNLRVHQIIRNIDIDKVDNCLKPRIQKESQTPRQFTPCSTLRI